MQQKISEYTFLTLISTAIFIVWRTLFSGHTNAWYWTNFFTTNFSFFSYFFKERDILQYISNFSVLFFKWNWVEAFILTSSLICIYLLIRKLLQKHKFARDMLLCTLLQQREYNLFCGFCTRYIDTNEELPTLYQEALLMAKDMGISAMEGKSFHINEQTQNRWQEFVKIFNNTQLDNRSRQIALRPFRYTWWYYCLMSPEKIN